jgi:tetratricopeptide (TPR) repeat protein
VDEAKQLYKHALTQNPVHAKSHYNLGILHQAAGREQEARYWYERASVLDPALQVP